MTTVFFFVILPLEVALVGFVVWCYLNEKKLIRMENRIIAAVFKRHEEKAEKRTAERERRLNEKIAYTPAKPRKKRSEANREIA